RRLSSAAEGAGSNALHGNRAFKRRRRARNLSAPSHERADDARRTGLHLELDRSRLEGLLATYANRRFSAIRWMDRKLARFDRFRNRPGAHFGGSGRTDEQESVEAPTDCLPRIKWRAAACGAD